MGGTAARGSVLRCCGHGWRGPGIKMVHGTARRAANNAGVRGKGSYRLGCDIGSVGDKKM